MHTDNFKELRKAIKVQEIKDKIELENKALNWIL